MPQIARPARWQTVVRLIAAAVVLNAASEASVALACGCAAIIVIAWLRPRAALYCLAITAPWLDWWWPLLQLPPARVTDAAVLSTLVGCWRGRPAGINRYSFDAAPLLILIVVVSAVARLAAVSAGLPLTDTLRDAAQYGRIFLTGAAHPFDIAGHVASVVAGIALFITTRRIIVDRTHTEHLTAALVLGGAIWAVAALGVYGLRFSFMDITRSAYRDALLIPDPNAAGSYFALLLFPAAALAIAGPKRGIWSAVVAALLGATWLTWSSAAVLAATGMLIAVILSTARIARRTQAAIALAAIVISVAHLSTRGSEELTFSWTTRRDFVVTSAGMIGDEPLFGVGAGRYLELSPHYMPAALREIYGRENAHNQYLQIAAEVGVAGLVVFAILIWRSLRYQRPGAAPMALGVTAFLLSALAGHPLLVTPVAVLFWMAIANTGSAGAEDARPTAIPGWLIGAIVLLVAYTAFFPARWRRELDRTVGTAAGAYAAEDADALGSYRWTAGRVVLFPGRESTHVRFALRQFPGGTQLEASRVLVSGLQRAHAVTLSKDEIYCVEGVAVETGLPFHRIDLRIHPVWYDATLLDRRTFGVQLMPADGWLMESCPQ